MLLLRNFGATVVFIPALSRVLYSIRRNPLSLQHIIQDAA